MTLARAIAMAGCVLAVSAAPASSQTVMERVDLSAVQKIRDEGLNRSKLDELASYLTDVIGARLTNSPGSRKANEWAAETFRSWGLANVKVEPWVTLLMGKFRALNTFSGHHAQRDDFLLGLGARCKRGSQLARQIHHSAARNGLFGSAAGVHHCCGL